MADNKKYYYIRLKENFFDSDEIKLLESIPNDGYKFSNILLKMYLKSLKYDGRLMFNERIPFNAEMLATVTGHSLGDVTRAIDMFKKFGLIEVLETGEIYMLDIQSFIGKTSTEADRKRRYRSEIDEKKSIGTN
ncbi:phage replisome organizer N-terminal domain-containing protein, partial [Leuconostoc pseudomesenteroides]